MIIKHKSREGMSFPRGRIKILEALSLLLEKKDFQTITWAEIANTAGVNEALIYKYFGNKRNLLHQLLGEMLSDFVDDLKVELNGSIEGAMNKLRKFIWSHINIYNRQRVFAKILVLEVRNYPGYFRSKTYLFAKKFSKILSEIIEEGIQDNIFRDDIPVRDTRQIILGAIEHICLPSIIYSKEMDPAVLTERIMKSIVEGIRKK